MSHIFYSESTLTDRYQTTIPEPIREALHLSKRDKIEYVIDDQGKVMISRAEKEDPIIGAFLSFIAKDIKQHPEHIRSFDLALVKRANDLVAGISVDLDVPLSEKDE